MTLILGTLLGKKKATVTTTDEVGENIFEKIHVTERKMAETQKNEIAAYADGVLIPIEEVDDDTFAQRYWAMELQSYLKMEIYTLRLMQKWLW